MAIPNPIDVIVGQRLRLARVQAGDLGPSSLRQPAPHFQQVQKYERGINRLSWNCYDVI